MYMCLCSLSFPLAVPSSTSNVSGIRFRRYYLFICLFIYLFLDPFIPSPTSLLVNLRESKEVIIYLFVY